MGNIKRLYVEKKKGCDIEAAHLLSDIKENLINYLLENSANLPSQRQIAEILGTNPQSLSRILKSLKNLGAITTNKGKIIILDSQKLAEIIG